MQKYFKILPMIGVFVLGTAQLPAFARNISVLRSNVEDMPIETETTPMLATAQGILGEYLADSNGKSLYVFDKDTPDHSNCTDVCAQVWMPFVVTPGENAMVTSQLDPTMVGTTQRPDGTLQVTYNQMPLYYYSADQVPGETRGQGVQDSFGTWFLVQRDGMRLIPNTITQPTPGETEQLISTHRSSAEADPEYGESNSYEGWEHGGGGHGGHGGGGHEGGGWDHGGWGHGGWDNDCYYWGTCWNTGGGGYGSCGNYTCYYNGYCCDACGSCFRQ